MSRDETLREYTNRYFENRNTLSGVKDEDVIAYYNKGSPTSSSSRRSTKLTLIPSPTSWPTSTS
jgi:hypothetical protein